MTQIEIIEEKIKQKPKQTEDSHKKLD